MQKEKKVRAYTRRTKSGKTVTVRAHTAKYDAAEKLKEMVSKKGAGNELEEKRKQFLAMEAGKGEDLFKEKPEKEQDENEKEQVEKKTSKKKPTRPVGAGTTGPTRKDPVKKQKTTSETSGVSKEAFKSWYHFNDWDKPRREWPKEVRETDAALKKQMGKKAYDSFCSDIDNNYSSRGHLSMFKKIGASGSEPSKAKSAKTVSAKESNWRKSSDVSLRKKGDSATGQVNVGKRTIDLEVTPTDKGYEVSLYDRKGNIGWLSNIHLTTLSDLSKHVKHEINPKQKLTSKLMDSGEIEYGTEKVTPKKLKEQVVGYKPTSKGSTKKVSKESTPFEQFKGLLDKGVSASTYKKAKNSLGSGWSEVMDPNTKHNVGGTGRNVYLVSPDRETAIVVRKTWPGVGKGYMKDFTYYFVGKRKPTKAILDELKGSTTSASKGGYQV